MNRTPNTRRGFTLVELLVVVLILAILMAVALPLYLNAIKNSEKGTARANMQTVANAEQSYKLGAANHDYIAIATGAKSTDAVPADWKSLADLGHQITGPGTRTYKVDLQATTPKCNDANGDSRDVPVGSFSVSTDVAEDGCFIPGVTAN